MKKKLCIVMLSLCLASSFTACGSKEEPAKPAETESPKTEESEMETPAETPVEKPAEDEIQNVDNPIDLISTGMTYEEVVKAFGVEGGKMSETTVSGSTVTQWFWNYADGSGYIAVTTQDGIVTAKNDVRINTTTSNITLDIFNQITTGMTYEEVKNLIGSDGTLTTDTNIGGVQSTMYMWKAADGIGIASIMFQNDAVVSASQTGLK
ncbi:DUF3862 domain-containing protein [Faecalicatena orotica]|uniref:DUF3862 domain-containing protein n=1 Tax=Faecalicatena orotica TaxID=1544 RepID=UPI003217F232